MKEPRMQTEDWNPEHVSKSSVQDNCALGCMRGELDKRIAELEAQRREDMALMEQVDAAMVNARERIEKLEAELKDANAARSDHRGRWQLLVNAIAGAWNEGMVYGDDDRAVADARDMVIAKAKHIEKLEGERDRTCKWTEERDGTYWNSGCGELHLFTDGGPDENKQKFCPYCGGNMLEDG